jgi:hypothetical protein
MKMKKILSLAIAIIPILVLTLPVNAAASVSTVTFHNVTASMTVTSMPCPDGSVIPGGLLTTTSNGVSHNSTSASGGMHLTATVTASLTLVATNEVTYTGHYTVWFGGNLAPSGASEFTATFSAHATGTDGTTISFKMTQHMTINPDGTVTSNINNFSC